MDQVDVLLCKNQALCCKLNLLILVHSPILQHYTLDGIAIDSVASMRDLGVIIDSDLKFHSGVSL